MGLIPGLDTRKGHEIYETAAWIQTACKYFQKTKVARINPVSQSDFVEPIMSRKQAEAEDPDYITIKAHEVEALAK